MTFIQQVTEQLRRMDEKEKDLWILSQAKLLKESEQQGFFMTLSGKKKIAYMPSREEIEEFCRKVENQAIYFEYETHYYEFDDDGRYMDDWKIWHNDPFEAVPFLDKVFRGCHDLLVLGEYKTVADILGRVCRLEFHVVEASDSEDCDFEPVFTLEDVGEERMLSRELAEIGIDWVRAVICSGDQKNGCSLAREIVEVLEHPVCKKIQPHMFLEGVFLQGRLSESFFLDILDVLGTEIENVETIFDKRFSDITYSREKVRFEQELIRKKEIAFNIRMKCGKADAHIQGTMELESSWKLLKELCYLLKYEYVVRAQWEVGEMQEICKGLLRKENLQEEKWELRKTVLADIVQHGYYEKYGCKEYMEELSNRLCIKKEEFLAFADMLNEKDAYQGMAAKLYRQYGQEDKYIYYLETHLGKQGRTYVDLMDCYRKRGEYEKARKVARQGLEQCRDDLTELFIYLLADARDQGDIDEYKRLYASAKRRKGADIARIDGVLKGKDRR